MKRPSLTLALLPALALLGPVPAAASTVSECHAAIRTLSQRTDDMLYLGGDPGQKARAQLLVHLSRTSDALDRVDLRAALKHLDAYSADLSRAAASGRLKPEEALVLQEGANGVIVCIGAIGR